MTDNIVFRGRRPILDSHQHRVADEWLFRFAAVRRGTAILRIILP